jgi:hypothetical protein
MKVLFVNLWLAWNRLWMPKHTVQSVAKQLADGLEDGSITLNGG